MRPFRFGLVWRGDVSPVPAARRAEDAGYSTLLFPDHTEMLAPVPAMAAAAAVTRQLRLGTQVVNIAFRPLGALAQELAAVDVISEGRLEVGLGAGYAEGELHSLGLPFPGNGARIRALGRALEVLPRLFAGQTVTEEPGPGRLTGYRLDPPAPQGASVPLMVGGHGDRILGVAARGAGIVQVTGFLTPPGGSFPDFTDVELAERVAVIRDAAGERFDRIELSVLIQLAGVVADPSAALAELPSVAEGLLPVQRAARSSILLFGSVDALCDRLREMRERTGVSYVTVFDGRSDGFDAVVARLAGT